METTDNITRLLEVEKGVAAHCESYFWGIMPEYINQLGYTSFVEVGVLFGGHCISVLDKCPGIKEIIGIDPYKYYGIEFSGCSNQQDFDDVYKIANENFAQSEKMKLLRSQSYADPLCPNCKYDCIFIDGNHEYAYVKADIAYYSRHVEPGGLLCGHDYNSMEGVTRAVNEYVDKHKIRLIIEESANIWIIRL